MTTSKTPTSEQATDIAQTAVRCSQEAHTALLEAFSPEIEVSLAPYQRIQFLRAKAQALVTLTSALETQESVLKYLACCQSKSGLKARPKH